jgi:hypothetical protein
VFYGLARRVGELEPLISAVFPLRDVSRAMEQSLRKNAAMKVQLAVS